MAPYQGMRVHVNTGWSLERHILFSGEYEPTIADIIRRALQPGDNAIDIGANIGAQSIVMALAVGKEGSVISVEPHPQVAARLKANIDLNFLTQVEILEAAFSNEAGTTKFFGFDPGAAKKGISSLKPDARASVPIEVQTISGKTFTDRFPMDSLALIKVDVEGAEQRVLSELRPLIQRHQPIVVFEHHKVHWDKFGHSLRTVLDQFKQDAYRTYIVDRKILPMQANVPDECDILAVPKNSYFEAP